MKQEINLLVVEKKTNKFEINAAEAVKIILVFASVLLMISVYDGIQSLVVLRQIHKTEAEKEALESSLAKEESQLPIKQNIDQLKSAIEIQTSALKIKKDMLKQLIDSENKQIQGFSEYLASLSRKTIAGLWLTRMVFSTKDAHYVLEGRALQSDYIPKFMEGLSQEPMFTGQTYQVFKVSVDKTKGMNFLLETSAREDNLS